jgi:DNA-binding transcriptional LysR family regulator
LTVHTLRSEALVAVLPERHPLAEASTVRVADLRAEPFIGYPSGHRSVVRDAVLAACAHAGYDSPIMRRVLEKARSLV